LNRACKIGSRNLRKKSYDRHYRYRAIRSNYRGHQAKRLSILSMMSTTAAGSGHPTSCMSAAELVAGTFFYAMKFDPKDPNPPDGDRFVLSTVFSRAPFTI
jgi:transketolase N-terminal domain/subunit